MDEFDRVGDDEVQVERFPALRSILIATAGFSLIVAWAVWRVW